MHHFKKIFHLLILCFILFSCSKKADILQPENQSNTTNDIQTQVRIASRSGNPMSLKNIRFAAGKLAGKNDLEAERYTYNIPLNQQMIYFKFNPNEAHKSIASMEQDTSLILLNTPFADVDIYRNAENLTEQDYQRLKDGMIYGMLPIDRIATLGNINIQKLDTLYNPESDEDPIMMESLVRTGFVSREEANQRIFCRNPLSGRIRHEDTEFGANNLQPVRGMKVIAFFLGLPRVAHTDMNGFYATRWRFLVGAFVFTKAANSRAIIKPINSANGWAADIGNIITNFVIGSVTAHGWSPCRWMRNFNINYTGHDQRNLWCHMLNSVAMHHAYMRNDNLEGLTPNRLVMYAHWSEETGSGSAPMLSKLVTNDDAILAGTFALAFGTGSPIIPAFYLLYVKTAPDITIRESADINRRRTSSELMQVMFHELGHAAHFSNVGGTYWLAYITQIVSNTVSGNDCGTYGCGNEILAGVIQVGESWAEFIGTDHALRYHANGQKISRFFGGNWVRFDRALEEEPWFDQRFIGTGVFHDFRDGFNVNEPNDNVEGVTIRQMYNALTSDATNLCRYLDQLILQNNLDFNLLNLIFIQNLQDPCNI